MSAKSVPPQDVLNQSGAGVYSQATALVALGLCPLAVFAAVAEIDGGRNAFTFALTFTALIAIPISVLGVAVFRRPPRHTLLFALGIVLGCALTVAGSGFALIGATSSGRDASAVVVVGAAMACAGFLSIVSLHRTSPFRSPDAI